MISSKIVMFSILYVLPIVAKDGGSKRRNQGTWRWKLLRRGQIYYAWILKERLLLFPSQRCVGITLHWCKQCPMSCQSHSWCFWNWGKVLHTSCPKTQECAKWRLLSFWIFQKNSFETGYRSWKQHLYILVCHAISVQPKAEIFQNLRRQRKWIFLMNVKFASKWRKKIGFE